MTHLEVSVSWEKVVLLLIRALDHDTNQSLEARFNFLDLIKEPKAHIGRDLIISRATRVQLAT